MAGTHQPLLRQLPSVDRLLASEAAAQWLAKYPRARVVAEIRESLEQARQGLQKDPRNGVPPAEARSASGLEAAILAAVSTRLERFARPSLRRVINASGVLLHTNLGRAPLSQGALAAIAVTTGGYSNLEYDLPGGRRGKRDVHVSELLAQLLGAPAIVVNNNAAAIFLVLNELASGGEVIVSRGELIEIGDGFRIPDILVKSGARLREVGTTNRTRIEDFEAAITADTRLLLRVHPSNFRMVGFTARPSLEQLTQLSRQRNLPLVEDLGSGCLYDFAKLGFEGEPPVTASLQAGVDIVTFSGDKLLGGPQAGLIAGRAELVARIRRNPLFRALRADKMTYAALEATLRDYILERWDEIPLLRMVRQSADEVRTRASAIVAALGPDFSGDAEIIEGQSVLGGGSTPDQSFATTLIAIQSRGRSAAGVEQRLRDGDPAVLARLEHGKLLFDPRTVFPEEEEELVKSLRRAFAS